MRNAILSLVVLVAALIAPAVADAGIWVCHIGGFTSDPIGWSAPTVAGYVMGDIALGESPDDVSVTCNKNWLAGGVGSPTWDGTVWTVEVGAMGYNNAVVKTGTCGIFIDFTGGGVADTFNFTFE